MDKATQAVWSALEDALEGPLHLDLNDTEESLQFRALVASVVEELRKEGVITSLEYCIAEAVDGEPVHVYSDTPAATLDEARAQLIENSDILMERHMASPWAPVREKQ